MFIRVEAMRKLAQTMPCHAMTYGPGTRKNTISFKGLKPAGLLSHLARVLWREWMHARCVRGSESIALARVRVGVGV